MKKSYFAGLSLMSLLLPVVKKKQNRQAVQTTRCTNKSQSVKMLQISPWSMDGKEVKLSDYKGKRSI